MRITRIYEERLTRRFCATNLSQSPDRVQLAAASPENLKSVDPRDADPMRFTGAKKSFSPTPNFFSCYLFHVLLSFLFCYLLCDTPGASENSRNPSHFLSSQMCWRREWDLNPRGPKGHRLTGEPIPDMGPRARQTARYQAPESRPTRPDPLNNYFSPLENNNRAQRPKTIPTPGEEAEKIGKE